MPKAHEDLKRVLTYLRGFYPSTPLKFDREYQRLKSRLAYNPRCCSPYPGNPAYRRAFVGKYSLFYKIAEEPREVHIHRILRSNWDIPPMLQETEE
ncbi:MAG: type II toxin-antitoxin system RelE/ParE family toxin [Oscillospiraceae bacterium]|nr:type II toxin-antitoxin system RelE/ParE family toxin [Oscillospiraceae bacterium]